MDRSRDTLPERDEKIFKTNIWFTKSEKLAILDMINELVEQSKLILND